ncbi:hypothetical protein [Agrobacterium cavarae]|uniref:hypothetical protein n=1 Tax=Agrobacterium cavarae TaxID=2528239 RepID=UPI0028AF9EEB|nr:hypothetical protein [Agrobacterium cavarae]
MIIFGLCCRAHFWRGNKPSVSNRVLLLERDAHDYFIRFTMKALQWRYVVIALVEQIFIIRIGMSVQPVLKANAVATATCRSTAQRAKLVY